MNTFLTTYELESDKSSDEDTAQPNLDQSDVAEISPNGRYAKVGRLASYVDRRES